VYWDERATYASQDGTVKSYDPSSDRVATVYRGPVGYTQVSANGLGQFLGGTDTTVVPAPLPAPIASALSSYSRAHLNTDGRAYAWLLENPGVVGWWAPGQAAPRYLRLPRGTYAEDGAGAVQVAGRFLVAIDGDTQHVSVIDAEVGATAELPAVFPGVTRPGFYLAHDGQLAGIGFTESNGHYINGYWAEAATTVLRLDTRSLPPLRC
jgi:hypothetical protein